MSVCLLVSRGAAEGVGCRWLGVEIRVMDEDGEGRQPACSRAHASAAAIAGWRPE